MTAIVFSFRGELAKRTDEASRIPKGIVYIRNGVHLIARQSLRQMFIRPDLNRSAYGLAQVPGVVTDYRAGKMGVSDFHRGFSKVVPDNHKDDSLTKRVASAAYGVYFATSILLPGIIEQDPLAVHKREQLVGKLRVDHPEISVSMAQDLIVRRAGATIARVVVSQVLNEEQCQSFDGYAHSGTLLWNKQVGEDFRHILPASDVTGLLGGSGLGD